MPFLSERFANEALSNFDICIIGGGAAGLILFNKLSKKDLRVVLCEGGGEQPTDGQQSLFRAGYQVGFGKHSLSDSSIPTRTRLRMLGGTTGHWGRQLMEFDDLDFVKRSWIPHSGWAFEKNGLAPWYHRAKPYFGLSDSDVFEPSKLAGSRAGLELEYRHLEPHVQQMSRVQNLKDSPIMKDSIASRDLILDANFIGFEYHQSRVTAAIFKSLHSGKTIKIAANRYVLACGTIENSRLLLNEGESLSSRTPTAFTNVGKYFLGHINLNPTENFYALYRKYDWNYIGAKYSRLLFPKWNLDQWVFGLSVRRDLQERLQLSNILCCMGNIWGAGDLAPIPDDLKERFHLNTSRYEPRRILSSVVAEQRPDPTNRIALDYSDRDQLGIPRAQIKVQIDELDYLSILKAIRYFAKELLLANVAFVREAFSMETFFSAFNRELSFHHMGGTRMGTDKSTSVVDENLKIHDMDNLYVLGSSVFPTGGFANPTYTIAALAMRLADHMGKS